MLIIIILVVSLLVGYALYSNFSNNKQKFKSSNLELSLRNILNLNEDPTELCNLWKNMENNEEFQVTIDGENAAQLSSDKSNPPKTTFDKSSTDALNKIVVDHINEICNSKKQNESNGNNTITTPTNNAPPAPAAAAAPATPEATETATTDPAPAVSEDSIQPNGAAANDVAGQAGSEPADSADNSGESEPADSADNSGESEPAPGVQQANSSIKELEQLEQLKKFRDRIKEKETYPLTKVKISSVINLDENLKGICEKWTQVEQDKEYALKMDGKIFNFDFDEEAPYKLKKSNEDENTKELNKICNTLPQQPAPQAQQAAPQTQPGQSSVNPNQPQSQPQTNTQPSEPSAVTAPTPDQRTQQENQFINRRNEFLSILRDGEKLEIKNFENNENNMFIDDLNDILADIKIKFEQRLGIKVEDKKSIDLTKLNELGFVRLANDEDDEKFKAFFSSFVSNLSNLKDKISIAGNANVENVKKVFECFRWLQQILFGVEGNPSLSNKVEEALRVRYLDSVPSDGIVSDYDRHRIKMASTEMPNRVMYFGNGEGSTDKLIFGSDSVLFNLVKIVIKNNDPIRVQIIEHYGEDREQDCYTEEKRTQKDKPIIDSFYYTDENLNIISDNNTKKGKYLKLDKGQVGRIFTDFGAFETFIGKIKEARRNLKSHSGENRIRRHVINEQSRSHLIVHLFNPGENVPYATIMDIAKSEPKEPIIEGATNGTRDNPVFVKEEIIKNNWRNLFFESEKQNYKDLSGLIEKVKKAIKFIGDKKNFNTAKKDLNNEPISHLYRNDNDTFKDLIHGGSGGDAGDDEFEDLGTPETFLRDAEAGFLRDTEAEAAQQATDPPKTGFIGRAKRYLKGDSKKTIDDFGDSESESESESEAKSESTTEPPKPAEEADNIAAVQSENHRLVNQVLKQERTIRELKDTKMIDDSNLENALMSQDEQHAKIQDMETKLNEAERKAKEAKNENEVLKSKLKENNQTIVLRNADIKRAESVNQSLLADKTSLEKNKEVLEKEVNKKRMEIDKKSDKIKENEQQITDLDRQLKERNDMNKAQKAELETEKRNLQESNRTINDEKVKMEEANEINKNRIVTLETNLTELNNQIEEKEEYLKEANKSLETVTALYNVNASELQKATKKHESAQNHIKESKQQITNLKNDIEEWTKRTEELQEENKILRGNTGSLAFEDSFREFFDIIKFEGPLHTDKPLENTFRRDDDLWLFNEDEYKHFKNDKQNYQLIELHKLRNEIEKFELKPGWVSDTLKPLNRNVYNVIFRAYLFNKLIKKINQFLEDQQLKIQFNPIKSFDKAEFIRSGKLSIPKLANSPLFTNWKKPDQMIFSGEQEDFLEIWKKNFKKEKLKSPYEIRGYENMRNDFMDKVFCPVFHSAKYINRTYPIIDKFIKHINGDITIDVKKLNDKIELKIVEDLKIDFSADKNFTTIVHVKFNGGRKFGGGAHAMRGGSRYMNFKLSSRSVERIQNVSYYNIVKTIRWRYYLSRKKTEDSIEVTIFKDYLFTLIACVFLLAAGNDKLAYGTFIDQLLSIGLFYEFDQDLTALLLPYYLPFT